MNRKNKIKNNDDDKRSSKTCNCDNDIYLKNILQIGILDEAFKKVLKTRKVRKNADKD